MKVNEIWKQRNKNFYHAAIIDNTEFNLFL